MSFECLVVTRREVVLLCLPEFSASAKGADPHSCARGRSAGSRAITASLTPLHCTAQPRQEQHQDLHPPTFLLTNALCLRRWHRHEEQSLHQQDSRQCKTSFCAHINSHRLVFTGSLWLLRDWRILGFELINLIIGCSASNHFMLMQWTDSSGGAVSSCHSQRAVATPKVTTYTQGFVAQAFVGVIWNLQMLPAPWDTGGIWKLAPPSRSHVTSKSLPRSLRVPISCLCRACAINTWSLGGAVQNYCNSFPFFSGTKWKQRA